VTPGVVLSALRRVGLPALGVRTQPEGTTLVNFATIFFVEPVEFDRSLVLLGRSVRVQAWPVSFVWHHGDGSSAVSSVPGAPYPSKQVTYAYGDAGVSVRPWVEVVYAARFRVGSGPWREVGETVSVAGPESSLRVAEATAVLSGEYR
jgi:hypothetical protein